MSPAHRHRSSDHLILRKHCRPVRDLCSHRRSQIQLAAGLDPSLNRSPHKTLRQRLNLDRALYRLVTLHNVYSINSVPPILATFAGAIVFAFPSRRLSAQSLPTLRRFAKKTFTLASDRRKACSSENYAPPSSKPTSKSSSAALSS